nr:MAG TPA: hypothetical protein [Caudoviricetes sp.]
MLISSQAPNRGRFNDYDGASVWRHCGTHPDRMKI